MSGKELRRIRERLGLTQVAFAELVGVARNSVVRWESDTLGMRESAVRLVRRIAAEHGAATKGTEGKTMKGMERKRKGGR